MFSWFSLCTASSKPIVIKPTVNYLALVVLTLGGVKSENVNPYIPSQIPEED